MLLCTFKLEKIPNRFVIRMNISTHFYYSIAAATATTKKADDDGKTFCCDDDGINIDVSYAIYFTTDGAHLLIAVSATLHLLSTSNGAKVLNRLIDRIPVNGRHK